MVMRWSSLLVGGGVYGMYETMNRHMKRETSAINIANQAAASGASRQQITRNASGILRHAKGVAFKNRVDPESVLDQMAQVQAMTGNVGLARRSADFLTKYSQAFNASPADSAMMYSRMFMSFRGRNLHIKDEAERDRVSEEQARELALRFGAQGQTGSVEIKDYAKLVPRLLQIQGGMASQNPLEDLTKLGAFVQKIAPSLSNPERLFTAFQSYNAWMQKAARGEVPEGDRSLTVGKTKIPVVTEAGARNPVDVIMDMLDASGGDARKINVGNMRAMRVFAPLFGELRDAQGRGEDLGVILADLKRIMGSTATMKDVNERAAASQNTKEARFRAFKNEVQQTLIDSVLDAFFVPSKDDPSQRVLDPAFTDAIRDLVSLLPELVKALGKLAKMILENPKTSAALALSAPAVLEYAKHKATGGGGIVDSVVGSVLGTSGGGLVSKLIGGGSGGIGAVGAMQGLAAITAAIGGTVGGGKLGWDLGKSLGLGGGGSGALAAVGGYAGTIATGLMGPLGWAIGGGAAYLTNEQRKDKGTFGGISEFNVHAAGADDINLSGFKEAYRAQGGSGKFEAAAQKQMSAGEMLSQAANSLTNSAAALLGAANRDPTAE